MSTFTYRENVIWATVLRVLGLSFILFVCILHLQYLPQQIHRLKQGNVQYLDGYYKSDTGELMVQFVTDEASEKGLVWGDVVLNPEVLTEGEVGTPVTLLVKSGDLPMREVTLIRRRYPSIPWPSRILELSPRAHMYFDIALLCMFFSFPALFGLIAVWFRSNVWLAFFVVGAVANSSVLRVPDPLPFLSHSYLSAGAILLFILFPNGRLRPSWSWLLLFLSCNVLHLAVMWGISVHIPYWIFYQHRLELYLIVAGIIAYGWRKFFSVVGWRRLMLFFFGAPMILNWDRWLVYLGASKKFIDKLHLFSSPLRGWVTNLHYPVLSHIGTLSLFLVIGVVAYRYRNTFTSVERQQIKWLAFGFVVSIPFVVVLNIFQGYYYSLYVQPVVVIRSMADWLFFLAWVAFILVMVAALRHYRLWDVDMFINRALTYGGLIITAGIICLLTLVFIDQTIGSGLTNQDAFLIIPISIFLIVVTYKPMWIWLQRLADKSFPPDRLNFKETFIEFTPELRGYFTSSVLLKILAARAVEQMGVAHASAFMKNGKGKLRRVETVSTDKKPPRIVIKKQTLSDLEKGELVIQGADSICSIIVPLIVPRGQKLDFIGALMLGPRLNELGYSTEMKEQLKIFGKEIGTSLYIAQIKGRR
ncbi:MAG: hypothetical protein HY865_13105 [Chloroflexi bacterium]|nr:hypothetical protein [Chloroflexota bacterium]